MGHMVPETRDDDDDDDDLLNCDLETGRTSTSIDEEQGYRNPPISGVKQVNKCLNRVWSGVLHVDGLIKDEHIVRPSSSFSTSSSDLFFDKSSGGEDNVDLLRDHIIKEKRKRATAKKPPKPPRPPGSPSIGFADPKLLREISSLKRIRTERKAQKKMRATKSSSSSSSNSSLCAMIVTLIFCLIIIFQGMFSRNSSVASVDGSPMSSKSSRGPMISVHFYKNPSARSSDPGTGSPNLVEQVSWPDPDDERSRVAG